MRLTSKETSNYIHNKLEKIRNDIKDGVVSSWEKMAYIETKEQDELRYEKLGQLENIEDELGIDLVTLFKLINAKSIYSYGHTNIIRCSNDGVSLYDKSITIYNGTCVVSYPLSEYGKSFALTKEELE